MTWTRLDDGWTDKPELEDLDFATRWHYLAMIQFCSRNDRDTGIIRAVDARRCSDVPEPARALAQLEQAGLITIEAKAYRIVNIDEHVPPPYIRNQAEKAKLRKRRERAHKNGDHSLCIFGSCSDAPRPAEDVTGIVTRDIGTGRDGTGRAEDTPVTSEWAVVAIGEGRVAS